MPRIRNSDYGSLAELRYRIRQFLRSSDEAAVKAGLEPQQYHVLLAVRGLPHEGEATIRRLSERLFLRHHSVVGLVDRLEKKRYVRRVRGRRDQRHVCVTLRPAGQRALQRVVRERLEELRASGQALVAALTAVLESSAPRQRSRSRGQRKGEAIARAGRSR